MKKFIPKEAVEKARQIDLLTYLQRFEPDQLIKRSGEYRLVEHDSLVISNGLWHWTSRHIGGRSALDYLIKVRGMSLPDAVEQVMAGTYDPPEPPPHRDEKRFSLPPRSQNNRIALNYLRSRGIQEDILQFCIQKGYLYESAPHHNAVFVGMEYGTQIPRYAFLRGCHDSKHGVSFRGDVYGSKKQYSFRLEGTDLGAVHVFEAAIEALSYASLLELAGADWHRCSMLSLGGVAGGEESKEPELPLALGEWLRCCPMTDTVVLHLNNDEAGHKAAAGIRRALPAHIRCVSNPPPQDNDVNDCLCRKLNLREVKNCD